MPRILSIDTTTEFGSLALLQDGHLIDEVLLHSTDGFGHILFDRIAALLDLHGWNALGIDCFAAASGPGSFTGVRVGLAAAKGLAEAAGVPVVPVSNLAAVASFGTAPLRAAVLDARRGQVFTALFGKIAQPELSHFFQSWLDSLPSAEIEFLSTDFSPFRHALAGTRFEHARVTTAPRALAAAMGGIAWKALQAGSALNPASVDANYVRRSDAELFWKDG